MSSAVWIDRSGVSTYDPLPMNALLESLSVASRLLPASLLGLLLIVSGAVIGAVIGKSSGVMPVRFVSWWLGSVILPRLCSGGTVARGLTIFLNNSAVLPVVVACGSDFRCGVVAVLGLGVGLGIGVRVLARKSLLGQEGTYSPNNAPGVSFVVGIVLNLLEPPAILLAASLAVARPWVELSSAAIWQTYLLLAVPLLMLAAYGEAMWLGAVLDVEAISSRPDALGDDEDVDASDSSSTRR